MDMCVCIIYEGKEGRKGGNREGKGGRKESILRGDCFLMSANGLKGSMMMFLFWYTVHFKNFHLWKC